MFQRPHTVLCVLRVLAAVGVTAVAGGAIAKTEPVPQPVPPPAAPPAVVLPQPDAHHGYHNGFLGDARYRSPGLAVALSLTPLPVDFGNLYAENIGWGVAYTAAEVALMAPMMWLVGGHMDHGRDGDRSWGDGERTTMIALVSGYVGIKLVAGLHAGYAARDFNQRAMSGAFGGLLPVRGGAVAMVGARF